MDCIFGAQFNAKTDCYPACRQFYGSMGSPKCNMHYLLGDSSPAAANWAFWRTMATMAYHVDKHLFDWISQRFNWAAVFPVNSWIDLAKNNDWKELIRTIDSAWRLLNVNQPNVSLPNTPMDLDDIFDRIQKTDF